MKKLIFICSILIILFKTGNVLSNNKIFNVNNIEIDKEISQNKEKLINKAFLKAFDKLITRLLMEEDYKKTSKMTLDQVKKLISYYQITSENSEGINNERINVFFDKDRVHKFFYEKNILYSDIMNSEVILFPLLKKENQFFIYTKNYFYKNWNNQESEQENLIQYSLPVENIENIQKINLNKDSPYKIDIDDFFSEYNRNNIVLVYIEIKKDKAEVFLNTKIQNKKIKKTLSIKHGNNITEKKFYDEVIINSKETIRDLIKSQNLIDVRTPSFLNVRIKLNSEKNLVEFNNRIKEIDLIDNFYIQKLNKDYAVVKIKYLGKIDKIIDKLGKQKINLKMIEGTWQLTII